MGEIGPVIEPEIEVWNRSTSGVPWSERAGDVALAHALRLDGYAAAGSVLSGIEMEISEGWSGEARAGFAWFGLTEVVALLDEAVRDYEALNGSGLEGEEHADRYDEIDQQASDRYDELEVSTLLTTALQRSLTERPEEFAPSTGAEVEPRTDDPDEGPGSLVGAALAERPAYARTVPAKEKLHRTVQALTAFGLEASVEDGHVLLQPWGDDEDELLHAVFALIDLRYPQA